MKVNSSPTVANILNNAGAGMGSRYHVTTYKRVALTKYLYQVVRKPISDSSLLDVGCGHGIDCISAAMLGASYTVGIDVDKLGISHMRKVLRNLETQGFNLNVEPVLHNVVEGIPFEDNSFDIVFLIEAISHIVQLDRVLHEIHRVIKPTGALVINDSNNQLRRGIEGRTREVWERWENGPRPDAEQFPQHERSYRAMRKHMIQDKYPLLSEEEVDKLAAATTGQYGEGIWRIVIQYLRTGHIPDKRYQPGTCPVSPDGQYIERLFNPYHLAKVVQRIGSLRTVVMAHLTHGNWLRAAVDTIFRLLPAKISMPLSRGFIVVGYK